MGFYLDVSSSPWVCEVVVWFVRGLSLFMYDVMWLRSLVWFLGRV